MIAIVRVAKLLPHLGEALLKIVRSDIHWRGSSENFFRAMDSILFDPKVATTSAWIGPFGPALVAKIGATTATASLVSRIASNSAPAVVTYVMWLQPHSIATSERQEKHRSPMMFGP